MEQPVAHVTHGLNTAMETRRRPGRLSSSPASLRGTLRGEPRLWQLAGPGPRGGSLPSGVLRARRPGAWRELDLPTRRVIAAPGTKEGWADAASLVGEHVLRPAGSLGVRNAFEQLLVAQPLQPVGEDVGGNPEI